MYLPKVGRTLDHTRKRPQTELKPLLLNLLLCSISGIFDQNLTQKAHGQKAALKDTNALGRCRRMCGEDWGLNPKVTLWLYTTQESVEYGDGKA